MIGRLPPSGVGFGLAQRLQLAVERVSVSHEDIPPPLRTLDARLAKRVEELAEKLWRHAL